MSSYGNNHHTFLPEFAVTSNGFKCPFLIGCHCFASSGFIVCRSLKPGHTACPLINGQPYPLLRLLTVSCHSKSKCFPVLMSSYGNNHHTFWPEFTITSDGFKLPFLTGCHCFASSGFTVCKSLNPGQIALPVKYGQPTPLFLLQIIACHSKLKYFPVIRSLY